MTDPADLPPPGPEPRPRERLGRPPRFLMIVFALVILAAAGWSAVWYVGTRQADELVTAWLAEEAAKGRSYECGERSLGGYPFRVEVRCSSPELDIADAQPRIRLSAEGFRAVAQVWDLTHVIFEVDGPVRVVAGRPRRPDLAFDADWDVLQGSLRAPGGDVRRVDIAATNLVATPDAAPRIPGSGMTLSAQSFEIHGRRADGTAVGAHDIETAVEASDVVVARQGIPAPPPFDFAFVGRLDALPYPPPRDPAAFLSAWRTNGGSVDVTRLSATQDGTEMRAAGRIVPDAAGRPEGRVTISIAGPGATGQGEGAAAFGGLAPMIAFALAFVGDRTELDGRPAIAGEIDLQDGRVVIGGMPIAELPPLF